MKSNYKRLGDYIRQVDVRNRDLAVDNLLGVNLDKHFIPSVANTIGTDMSVYKTLNYNQFGCKLMSVARDGKMPICLYKEKEPALISSAYFVFEVIDENELIPDYLFMWIKRPEFDRQLWFSSGGDVRGGTTWNDLCNMPLRVPPIEEQRRIVAEYQAVEQRIENNRRLIATLEDAAQSIYRKMFVDDIDPNNLPQGWRMGKISDLSVLKVGGDKPNIFSADKKTECNIPIYSNGILNKGLYGYTNSAKIERQCFTISARGTIGACFLRLEPYFPIVRLISVIPKDETTLMYQYKYFDNLNIEGDGSVQNQLTVPFLESETMVIPKLDVMQRYNAQTLPLYQHIAEIEKEQSILEKLCLLVNSNLSNC